MKKQNKIVKTYLKNVYKKLDCPRMVKNSYIFELRDEVLAYVNGKSDVSLDELYQEFGMPAEVSFDREYYQTLIKKERKRAKAGVCVGVAAAVLLIVSVVFLIYMYMHYSGYSVISDPYWL